MTDENPFKPNSDQEEDCWIAWHDKELGQWQILDEDETKVIATGIEKEKEARWMAAAPELLYAVSVLRNDLECNGEILGTDSRRIELLEAALRAAGEEIGE